MSLSFFCFRCGNSCHYTVNLYECGRIFWKVKPTRELPLQSLNYTNHWLDVLVSVGYHFFQSKHEFTAIFKCLRLRSSYLCSFEEALCDLYLPMNWPACPIVVRFPSKMRKVHVYDQESEIYRQFITIFSKFSKLQLCSLSGYLLHFFVYSYYFTTLP